MTRVTKACQTLPDIFAWKFSKRADPAAAVELRSGALRPSLQYA